MLRAHHFTKEPMHKLHNKFYACRAMYSIHSHTMSHLFNQFTEKRIFGACIKIADIRPWSGPTMQSGWTHTISGESLDTARPWSDSMCPLALPASPLPQQQTLKIRKSQICNTMLACRPMMRCPVSKEALPFRLLGNKTPAWQTQMPHHATQRSPDAPQCTKMLDGQRSTSMANEHALARPHGTLASRRQHALRQRSDVKMAAMRATHVASARRRKRCRARHNMTVKMIIL